jgi:hypothetical protein
MKKILTTRKPDNSEFRIKILKENHDDHYTDIIVAIHDNAKKPVIEIINELNKGYSYYTKDTTGEYSFVTVKDGVERGPYLTSIANDGVTDNINELPIY